MGRVSSFILVHPNVWPQYTNVTDRTDRQTDRQRSASIGRTVLQTVAQNFEKFGHVILEICEQTDRQTDIQTRSSQYFAPLQGSK